MMNNRHLMRGLLLIAIALFFGLQALGYQIGRFSHAGPGLFPLIVSAALLLIGVVTTLQARTAPRVPLDIQPRNIALVLGSLCGFALLSHWVNMIAGIVFLVFFASLAASSYSLARCVKVSLGLIAVAFAFKHGLGLNLPLV